jgi:acetoacetyl-CoA synthetase
MAAALSEPPIWEPSAERIRRARLTAFVERLRSETGEPLGDYASLHRLSVDRPEVFWDAVWRFSGIRASRAPDAVVIDPAPMPGARWFPGARLNFARHLLAPHGEGPALVSRNEAGVRRAISRRELRRDVAAVARALGDAGVGPEDAVVALLPNVPEAVIAMLAAASLGATWSSCSPDAGPSVVLDRFRQVRPRALVTTESCRWGGKRIDLRDKLRAVIDGLGDLSAILVVPEAGGNDAAPSVPGATPWADVRGAPAADGPPWAELPFDHPLYVLYSSGTTGPPKGIVHGAGGTLLQHLKEHVLHTDLGPDDTILYHTTCGWMMWNWLVSALATGATVVLYDGAPLHPDPSALWRVVAEERVTAFGTSARWLAACEHRGARPARDHDLTPLRTLLSTGSPLAPHSYDWVYREVASDLLLASISGGTDIVSCFALGNPIGPVWRGEIACIGLGMAVEVLDDDGSPVRGRPGQLCCTRPFPSMPLGFVGDPGGERFRRAYFARYPGVWCHGDWAEHTEHDGLVIHGRSDATLNPGGVRIGTAEIYRVVETVPGVIDCLAVGQDWDGDVRVVLFVVLEPGRTLAAELSDAIRRRLREEASPRHVPAKILQVPDLPRTLSGKTVELAVREVIHGRPVKDVGALADPGALDVFRDLPELRR